MQFGLCVALLLLLVSGTVTPTDPRHEAGPPSRDKREIGMYDMLGDKDGLDLADALGQAAEASRGDFDGNVIEKLNTIIENQNQQLRLLLQLKARSPSSRFC